VLCENRNKPVLACNGKCYLQKQIEENSYQDFEHNLLVPEINLKDFPIATFQNYAFIIKKSDSDNQLIYTQPHNYKYNYSSSLLKPPKSIV